MLMLAIWTVAAMIAVSLMAVEWYIWMPRYRTDSTGTDPAGGNGHREAELRHAA